MIHSICIQEQPRNDYMKLLHYFYAYIIMVYILKCVGLSWCLDIISINTQTTLDRDSNGLPVATVHTYILIDHNNIKQRSSELCIAPQRLTKFSLYVRSDLYVLNIYKLLN